MSYQDDLDWLARYMHEWPFGIQSYVYVITEDDGSKIWGGNVHYCAKRYQRVDKEKWLTRRAELKNKPVSVSNETVHLEQHIVVAGAGDVGSANAWRSLHEWIDDETNNPQMALMKQVSAELHNDGCHSAWIHVSRFIEALFERIDDLETITDSVPDTNDEQSCHNATWHERGELPPVGTKCEYRLSTTSPWYPCEIKYVIHDDGVVMMREDGFEQFCSINSKLQPVSFRPILTERDEAIEAMKAHCPYPGSWETTYRLFAESLYDAGYRAGCSE